MTVLYFPVKDDPVVIDIEVNGKDEIKFMQALVHGRIHVVSLPDDLILVHNDDGPILQLELNRHILFGAYPVAGPFFVCRRRGDRWISLTQDDISNLQYRYSRRTI